MGNSESPLSILRSHTKNKEKDSNWCVNHVFSLWVILPQGCAKITSFECEQIIGITVVFGAPELNFIQKIVFVSVHFSLWISLCINLIGRTGLELRDGTQHVCQISATDPWGPDGSLEDVPSILHSISQWCCERWPSLCLLTSCRRLSSGCCLGWGLSVGGIEVKCK